MKENEGDIAITSRLCEGWSQRSNVITLVLLLGNIGLQIFSHLGISAIIMSSVESSSSDDSGGDGSCPTVEAGGCTSADEDVWEATNSQLAADLLVCALGDTAQCMSDKHGYTLTCAGCFSQSVQCTIQNGCTALCLDTASDDCLNCIVDNCADGFDSCTDFDVSINDIIVRRRAESGFGKIGEELGRPVPLTKARRRQSSGGPTFYNVYEISFVSSIDDCFEEGAWILGFLIILCSGWWPYAKNVIMFICWFTPMTESRREATLRWLTRLARFALLDVFVVIFILIGLQIDLSPQNLPIIIFGESHPAVWTFAIAAVWDLAQGEWMRHQNDKRRARLDIEDSKPEDHPEEASENTIFVDSSGDSYTLTPACNYISIFLGVVLVGGFVAGLIVEFARFETDFGALIVGMDPPPPQAYSCFTLLDEMFTGYFAMDYSTTPGGHIFLGLIFLIFGMVANFVQYSLLAFALLVGGSPSLYTILDWVSGYSCLDVVCLAAIIGFVEWNNLTTAATKSFDCTCGFADCVQLKGIVMSGSAIITSVVFLGYCLTYLVNTSVRNRKHRELQDRVQFTPVLSLAKAIGAVKQCKKPEDIGMQLTELNSQMQSG